jgi:hypothetical protein
MGGPRRSYVAEPVDAEWHGTSAGYVARGCGCPLCKAWNHGRNERYAANQRRKLDREPS